MSSKHDNFLRISSNRTAVITKAIRILGNLHSSNYEWSPNEVDAMFDGLQTALDAAHDKFKTRSLYRGVIHEIAANAEPEAISTPSHPDMERYLADALETVELQRRVIDTLQSRLDGKRPANMTRISSPPDASLNIGTVAI